MQPSLPSASFPPIRSLFWFSFIMRYIRPEELANTIGTLFGFYCRKVSIDIAWEEYANEKTLEIASATQT